jgi:hypothetical protein
VAYVHADGASGIANESQVAACTYTPPMRVRWASVGFAVTCSLGNIRLPSNLGGFETAHVHTGCAEQLRK